VNQEKNMKNRVFVGGIAWETTEEGLQQAFAKFGSVTEAKIITDKETGTSKGYGFVTYSDEEGATKAIDQGDGMDVDGRKLRVDRAKERDSNRRR
jgi:heterogeneous nuclear ribonucleoprotein A1/A3